MLTLGRAVITLFIALTAPAMVFAEQSDHQKIEAVIQKYFDGTSQGKPELVKEAFMPSLEVQWLSEGNKGEFRRRPGPDYINNIKPGELVPRVGRIVSIDVSDTAAAVKAEITWSKRLYTDYMLLLKVDGKWRVTNKIATWHSK